MKQKHRDWMLQGLAAALLAGAVGLIVWQGISYYEENDTSRITELIQLTETSVPSAESGTAETITIAAETDALEMTAFSEVKKTTASTAKRSSTTTKSRKTTTARISTSSSVSDTTTTMTTTTFLPDSSVGEEETDGVSFPLELNQATAEELEQLPGIGEVLAQRIIRYREQLGGFLYRDQLLEVEGIGEVTLAGIYDYLYLTDEQFPTETEPVLEQMTSETETIVTTMITSIMTTAVTTETTESETAVSETTVTTEIFETQTEISEISTEPLEIDLNQAELEDLMCLPEMTEELAEAILALRDEIQYFSSVYELLYVEDMTSDYFMQIQEYLTAEPPETTE